MSGIKAIIFDKDGTLFDFQATWSDCAQGIVRTLAGGDTALEARVADTLGIVPGHGFRPDSVMIAGSTADVVHVLQPVLPGQKGLAEVLNSATAGATQVPVPGLVEALEVLAKRHILGVVTNDTEAPARAHLAQVGITAFFQFVAGYDSGFGAKPGPGQLLAFCDAVGCAPDETLMVGDSRHDLEAARRAGMPGVAVLTGVAEAAELAPFAEVVLPSIADLPDWLSEHR